MVAGQGVLSGTLDVGALTAVEERLERMVVARGEVHVAALRDALELHRVYDAAGMGLSTVAHLALVLRCSELRAGELLADARMLLRLPCAFEAIAAGLSTVEGSQVLTAQLAPLDELARLSVWARLHAQRRREAADAGGVEYRRREDSPVDIYGLHAAAGPPAARAPAPGRSAACRPAHRRPFRRRPAAAPS